MRHRQQGFTLIEILITVLVFGLGILGISALSAKSQQIANKAYQQMQASWKAQELLEAMRANRLGDYQRAPASHGCMSIYAVSGSSCTPDELAEEELWLWDRSLEALLPAASWGVGASGARTTISVAWDSSRSGSLDTNTQLEFSR